MIVSKSGEYGHSIYAFNNPRTARAMCFKIMFLCFLRQGSKTLLIEASQSKAKHTKKPLCQTTVTISPCTTPKNISKEVSSSFPTKSNVPTNQKSSYMVRMEATLQRDQLKVYFPR